jgi:hypothetical protein
MLAKSCSLYMTNREMTAQGQLFVAAQKAKIHTQRQFIALLESQGTDVDIIQAEKETLAEMRKALGLALGHFRQV